MLNICTFILEMHVKDGEGCFLQHNYKVKYASIQWEWYKNTLQQC